METFTQIKEMAENPRYAEQKQQHLKDLDPGILDRPIRDLVLAVNALPYCFTLQSCHGHFVYDGQTDTHSLKALPAKEFPSQVTYRIAYLAFCVENSASGKRFLGALQGMTGIDPGNVQFGCAQWFWERQVNSYVLQVEPDRFKFSDTAVLDFEEALRVEAVRNTFFARLSELLQRPSPES